MSQIIPNLYLGNLEDSNSTNFLSEKNITAIVRLITYPVQFNKGIDYLQISVDDRPEEDLFSHFDESSTFIDRCLQQERNVLVHCEHGVSRSSTVVIAYLIYRYGMTREEAFNLVKSKRSVIDPNKGFWEQLKKYEFILNQN